MNFKDGICQFAWAVDGVSFQAFAETFQAREGRWMGAKVGLFAVSTHETGMKGYADFDWFRYSKYETGN